MSLPIDTILVPQGPEYQAVCRGMRQIQGIQPLVLPIPAGGAAVTPYLQKQQQAGYFLNNSVSRVLLMGLCGSLSWQSGLGDVVLYQHCLDLSSSFPPSERECDRQLTALLHRRLQPRTSLVRGLTSDRPICLASEKQEWGRKYQAAVVDMEGAAVLEVLQTAGIAVAILRSVSDDCQHDLPDLAAAIGTEGSLQPLPLALTMMQGPLAAARLIRGSLKALKILEQVTAKLFSLS